MSDACLLDFDGTSIFAEAISSEPNISLYGVQLVLLYTAEGIVEALEGRGCPIQCDTSLNSRGRLLRVSNSCLLSNHSLKSGSCLLLTGP